MKLWQMSKKDRHTLLDEKRDKLLMQIFRLEHGKNSAKIMNIKIIKRQPFFK